MTVGWETLDVGEKALIYSKDGRARIEEGPQRIFLFREKFRRMISYSASQKQYLIIRFKNGTVEHCKGPCIVHLNEIVHANIEVVDLISLDANEALVVYTQDNRTKDVDRRIQYGPTLFMMTENEWLHEFAWHGTDPQNKTKMIRGQDKFSRLRIIPDQFYYNVDEVRTKDDALMRVKLMMFFELVDIEKMLNSTKDPMADFINCLDADVIAFAAKKTYEEFIETASDLNNITNYPQLLERCKVIGYSVSKVVFRGYYAHEKLQKMHDMMITKRTQLQMKFEEEVQQQELTDKKLQAEVDRMEQEQDIEWKQVEHQQTMARDFQKHELDLERQSHEKDMLKQRRENEAKLNAKVLSNKLETDFLTKLHDMNVDVTKLLLNKSERPEKVTKIVASENAAHVHLHHNDLVKQPHMVRYDETTID